MKRINTARDPFEGNGSEIINFESLRSSLYLRNLGESDLQFTLFRRTGTARHEVFSFVLRASEGIDEIFESFDGLQITGDGPYRGYSRVEW